MVWAALYFFRGLMSCVKYLLKIGLDLTYPLLVIRVADASLSRDNKKLSVERFLMDQKHALMKTTLGFFLSSLRF